jgi:hypothetical protein
MASDNETSQQPVDPEGKPTHELHPPEVVDEPVPAVLPDLIERNPASIPVPHTKAMQVCLDLASAHPEHEACVMIAKVLRKVLDPQAEAQSQEREK